MPTGPLYYQPLVMARVLDTVVSTDKETGKQSTVFDVTKAAQDEWDKATQDQKARPKIEQMVQGFNTLQGELPGSKTFDRPLFSFDDSQYMGNRVRATLDAMPELLDSASPEDAVKLGAKMVEDAHNDFKTPLGPYAMRAVGSTLLFAPSATQIFKSFWSGDEVSANDAAAVSVATSRALQAAVTPQKVDEVDPKLQWLETGTQWAMSLWPGAAGHIATTLGLAKEAKPVDDVIDGMRGQIDGFLADDAEATKSVSVLLGAAGIDTSKAESRGDAFKVLQSESLDKVPAGIAQAIVAHDKLPDDKKDYITGRIVDTAGKQGNVVGLLAELDRLKRVTNGEPPPDVDPPAPGQDTPPPADPSKSPAPSTPPPGDVPKDDSPAPQEPPSGDSSPSDTPAPAPDPAPAPAPAPTPDTPPAPAPEPAPSPDPAPAPGQ